MPRKQPRPARAQKPKVSMARKFVAADTRTHDALANHALGVHRVDRRAR